MRTIPARGGAGPTPGGIDVSGDDQLLIPPSFDAVHADARGRRQLPRAEFAQRYELCEDMAQMLVEHSQAVHHDQGVDPEQVLRRTEAGLASHGSGFAAAEAAFNEPANSASEISAFHPANDKPRKRHAESSQRAIWPPWLNPDMRSPTEPGSACVEEHPAGPAQNFHSTPEW